MKRKLLIEVFCSCGEVLCDVSETRVLRNRSWPQVVVEPCPRCLEKEYDRGYQEGQESNET